MIHNIKDIDTAHADAPGVFVDATYQRDGRLPSDRPPRVDLAEFRLGTDGNLYVVSGEDLATFGGTRLGWQVQNNIITLDPALPARPFLVSAVTPGVSFDINTDVNSNILP